MIITQNPYVVGLSSAWTLAPELFFYLVAPFLMRSRKTGLGALVIFLGVRLGFVAANGTEFQGLWTYMFAPSSYCFFLLGHVVCLSSARWRSLASPVFGVALLLVSFGTMAFAPVGGFDGPRFWASVLCFTLALPGFFVATKNIRWMNHLGDLSYTVYLVHGIVIAVAAATLADALPLASSYLSISVLLALVLTVAVIAHWTLERPTARAMLHAAGYFARSTNLRWLGGGIDERIRARSWTAKPRDSTTS
jgi:peptidoglycan/LPS O-acetylase OafA/YrhL